MVNKKFSINDSEAIAKAAAEHDLNLEQFASISALRGKQFGREIYTALIPFKDLHEFLQVFPEVQRNVSRSKVRSVQKYVVTGVIDRFALRFFSSITATARGGMFYDEGQRRVAIHTKESRLSVNDGQHRFFGIALAIDQLERLMNRSATKEEFDMYAQKKAALEEMVIPIVIFNQIGEREEKQLFHDLNNLASRPSRSSTIKLAQTDAVAVMARELAEENPYFKRYGVESDKGMIRGKGTGNTILLTAIYRAAHELIRTDKSRLRGEISPTDYPEMKRYVNETFSRLFQYLPTDLGIPGKYLISRAAMLPAVCRFIFKGRTVWDLDEDTIFNAISRVDWTENMDYWHAYGGSISPTTRKLKFGTADQTQQAILAALADSVPPDQRVKIDLSKRPVPEHLTDWRADTEEANEDDQN